MIVTLSSLMQQMLSIPPIKLSIRIEKTKATIVNLLFHFKSQCEQFLKQRITPLIWTHTVDNNNKCEFISSGEEPVMITTEPYVKIPNHFFFTISNWNIQWNIPNWLKNINFSVKYFEVCHFQLYDLYYRKI